MADPDKQKQKTGPEGMTTSKQATPQTATQDQGKDETATASAPAKTEAAPATASAEGTTEAPKLTDEQKKALVAKMIEDGKLLPIGTFATLPMDVIEIGDIALRPAQTESDDFKGLMASIEAEGMNQNILVKHSDQTPGKYMLVDGLQRTTIAQMLGKKDIQVKVVAADEAKQHSLQIQMNLHRVPTKPAQFGASIRRMMALNPALTVVDLASELNVSTSYITDRINLKNLMPEIADKVDAGEITASAAFKLSKLPQQEQPNFVARAVSMPIAQFTDQVEARVTEINTAKREGRKAEEEKFEPLARLRKKGEFETEHQTHAARAELVTPLMTPQEAFDAAIAWGLQLDPASVEVEREKWEAEKKARDERAKALAAAQEAKKKAKGDTGAAAAAAALAD